MYSTDVFLGDSRQVLKNIEEKSVNLIITSHDAGLINPDNCSGFFGDSGMATTLPHGLGGPEVNRPATPVPQRIF